MRHFSATVTKSSAYAVNIDVSFDSQEFLDCQEKLILAMDASPSLMNPAEERVLDEFIQWFSKCKQDDLQGYPNNPIFVYVNMNTGYNQVFVVTDAKGKIHF